MPSTVTSRKQNKNQQLLQEIAVLKTALNTAETEVHELRLRLHQALKNDRGGNEWKTYSAQLLDRISRLERVISLAIDPAEPSLVTRSYEAAAKQIAELRVKAAKAQSQSEQWHSDSIVSQIMETLDVTTAGAALRAVHVLAHRSRQFEEVREKIEELREIYEEE